MGDEALDPQSHVLDDLVDEVVRRLDAWVLARDRFDPLPTDSLIAAGGRLADLATQLELSPTEFGLLVVGLAAAVEPAVAERCIELDRPLGRAQPRVDTALELAGGSLRSVDDRSAIGPHGTLVRSGLVQIVPVVDRPLGHATIVVDERVVHHVLGDDRLDPDLEAHLASTAVVDTSEVATVVGALASGHWALWLHAPHGGGASVAATAFGAVGLSTIALALGDRGQWPALDDVARTGVREAVLAAGGLVVTGVDMVRDRTTVHELLADPARPTCLVSDSPWDPGLSSLSPVMVEVHPLDEHQRHRVWRQVVGDAVDDDALASLGDLRLAPEQIVLAHEAARATADAHGVELGPTVLRSSALRSSLGHLATLGRRIAPEATLDDLVLPEELIVELRSIPERFRTIPTVRDEWRLVAAGRRGGISCLFAGSSGTGKTMSAEVVAGLLGVELYLIDLSQVVDKYIGETEKNLGRIFDAAERLNCVLLFDEADALFGKRSAVKDAHDRHANIEVSYLLQRMERYEGVAVLTTNLRANMDDAFTRRLDVICTFPDPSEAERLELWRRHLPARVPQDPDLDLALLAGALPLSGGHIRNITVTAAHSAAAADRAMSMTDLVLAVSREYRKLGRLFDPTRFQRWLPSGAANH